MVRAVNQKQRQAAYKVVLAQLVMTVVMALLVLLRDKNLAIAVFVGATISLIASAYFTLKVFRYSGVHHSQQVVKSFYAGETGKFVITFVLFAMAFKWLEILKETQNAFALLLAFFIVHTTAWISPLLLSAKKNRSE